MGALKIIVPVITAVILVWTVNSSVMAEQNINQATVENSKEQLLATNSCPRCDLSGVDLDRANLTGANLEGAILSKAKFRLATLTKANLRNTDLRDAELGGADLADADLRGADLRGTILAGAYLVGAQFDKEMSARQSSEAMVAANDSAGNVAKNDLPAASQEPGFLDNTLQGVKGLFGLGDAEKGQEVTNTTDKIENSEKVIEAATPEQPPLPETSAADNVPAIEETQIVTKEIVGAQLDKEMSARQSSEAMVAENDSAGNAAINDLPAASQEPGFLDNTLQGVKGLFGLGDAEKVQEVTNTTDKLENSEKVITAAAPVQPPLPAASVADHIPTIEETSVVTKEAEPAVAEESGLFDNTVARVKGLFGKGESRDHATMADNTEDVIQKDKLVHEAEATDSMSSKTVSAHQAEAEKNKALLLKTKRCYGCNLVSVDLSGKNLEGADLEGADLTGSNLHDADLEKANLKGALLLRVDLRGADLRGADLYKANLSGADLTGARLDGALLDDTQISDAVGFAPKN